MSSSKAQILRCGWRLVDVTAVRDGAPEVEAQ